MIREPASLAARPEASVLAALRGEASAGPDPRAGTALVWALVFSVLSAAMIVSHSTYMAANRTEVVRIEDSELAVHFARSGLTDTLGWFQRQPVQPVAVFEPKFEPAGDPPLFDTIDPTLGLVQEFEVRGSLWGRYEVRTDELADVSAERAQDSDGMVWDVGARGYLYRLADPTRRFDQAPNEVIASAFVRTEMRGIALMPPAQAAVALEDPSDLAIGPQGKIAGGGRPGVAFPTGGALPALAPGAVEGMPAAVSIVHYESSPADVFSMGLAQLRSLSDFVIEPAAPSEEREGGGGGDGSNGLEPAALLPQEPSRVDGFWSWWESRFGPIDSVSSAVEPRRQWRWSWQRRRHRPGRGQESALEQHTRELEQATVFVDGDIVLGPNDPLVGKALIVVDGDLVIEEGNESALRGLVYVNGDARIDGDFRLEGMLVVRGKLRLGFGSKPAVIQYDATALEGLKRSVERYRLSRSLRPGWTP